MTRVSAALWSRLWTIGLLALLLCYSMMPLGISAPNERSRLYLTVAMVERQVFNIDAERQRHGRVLDEAHHASHFYSDKAPGASILAAPAYWALRTLKPTSSIEARDLLLLGRYAVMLPITIGSFFAFEALALALKIRKRLAHSFAYASILATPTFHYGAAFFGHHIVATCWLLVLLALLKRENSGLEPRRATRLVLAGAGLGLAQLTEYQAIVGTVVFVGYWFATSNRHAWREFFWLLLGALPFIFFFGFYHQKCFGAPFEPSYHHLVSRELAAVHGQGIGGVIYPHLDALWGCLFSLHRGLFSVTPLLLLFPFGVLCVWRRGNVACAIALGALAALSILFVSSSLTWEAGWGYGSRLLLPVTPMLVLLVAYAAEQWVSSRLFWVILCPLYFASLAGVQAVTAFFPEAPVEFRNPLRDVVWSLAREQVFPASQLPRQFGLSGWFLLLPLVVLLAFSVLDWLKTVGESTKQTRYAWSLLMGPLLLIALVWVIGASVSKPAEAEFVRFARAQLTVR